MGEAAISVAELDYRVGTVEILRDVSFSVDEGAYMSIIGPNGAGKTSLIRCLNRILNTAGGRITVFGRDLSTYSQRDLAKVMSYVPQADGRQFPFTAGEFVMMGCYPYLSPFSSVGAEDRRIVDEALALTDTEVFADRNIQTLSGGERQKVYVAAALAQGSRIMLLDEPTAFLDYKHQIEIQELLRRLNVDEGITILAATHDVNSLLRCSDSVLALKEGRVVFTGSPAELIAGDALESVYDTPFHLVQDGEVGNPIVVPGGDGHGDVR